MAAAGVRVGKAVDELAMVGSAHGKEAPVVGGGAAAEDVRGGGCIEFALCEGGRRGCMAGDALMKLGDEFRSRARGRQS